MPALPLTKKLQPLTNALKRLTTITPQEPTLTVGLDLGSSSIKAIALGPRKGASVRPIIAQTLTPLQPGQDVDASEAMKTAIAGLNLSVKTINLSVSGQWVIIRIVEMPTMNPREVKQALPFEAQRYLPFNVSDVLIDGAVLGPADANKSWVLIVACKKELIDRRIDWAKRIGVDVALIDVDALALANAFLASGGGRSREAMCALMNVGAQLTSLLIFQGDIPYLVRDIPWGAEKLARNTAEQLGLDPAAVHQQLLQDQVPPEMAGALKLSTETLLTELQLSFDYFENRFGQPPETIFVSGGLSQSVGFMTALKSHLTQPVTPWTPVKGLSGQFAVAYGLALRAN